MWKEEHEVRKSFFRLFAAFLFFWGVGFLGFAAFFPLEDWVMNTAVG
jgi:hypothetical protein